MPYRMFYKAEFLSKIYQGMNEGKGDISLLYFSKTVTWGNVALFYIICLPWQ